jgi:hypothetical protein
MAGLWITAPAGRSLIPLQLSLCPMRVLALRSQRVAHVKLASTNCICLENHRFRTTCVLIDNEKTFSPGNSCRAETSSGHGSRRRIAEENLRNDRHKRHDPPPLARLEARLLGKSDGTHDRERAPEGDSGDAAPSGLRTPGTPGLCFRFEFAGLTWIKESVVSLSANWRAKDSAHQRRRRPINYKARGSGPRSRLEGGAYGYRGCIPATATIKTIRPIISESMTAPRKGAHTV